MSSDLTPTRTHGGGTTPVSRNCRCFSNPSSRIPNQESGLRQGAVFPLGSTSTHPSKKLADKFLGPYEVIAQPGTHSVTLRLPDSLCAVHPMFHVSMLEPATLNAIPNRVQPPLPPIFVDSEPEFEIAEVLDSKMDHRHSKCKLLYLVHWTRYASIDEETSWILASELKNAPDLISDFHQVYPAKPGPLGQL